MDDYQEYSLSHVQIPSPFLFERREASSGSHPLGNEEGQLQRLLAIQPLVAEGVVAGAQILLGNLADAAANALDNIRRSATTSRACCKSAKECRW